MGIFRLGRPHRGLCNIVGMHMLLKISLVGCRGKSTVLAFLMRLAGGIFFRLNLRLRILNTCISSLRFLADLSLAVF